MYSVGWTRVSPFSTRLNLMRGVPRFPPFEPVNRLTTRLTFFADPVVFVQLTNSNGFFVFVTFEFSL